MSIYVPTVWRNNTTPSLNATNLNHMEVGVESAHNEIEELVSGAVSAGHATRALVADQVEAASRLRLGGIRMWVDTSDSSNPIGYIEV
jgi:hypothetical protein